MPVDQILEKKADEDDLYDFDFAKRAALADRGETLTGTPTITATPSGLTIGSPVLSGSRVQAEISGGVAGTTYTLRCTVSTSGGHTLIEDGELKVVA